MLQTEVLGIYLSTYATVYRIWEWDQGNKGLALVHFWVSLLAGEVLCKFRWAFRFHVVAFGCRCGQDSTFAAATEGAEGQRRSGALK